MTIEEAFKYYKEICTWNMSLAAKRKILSNILEDAYSDHWRVIGITQEALNVFVFLFRNGDSLANYVSHIRSVLSLLRSSTGVLHDTSRILEGARKLTPFSCRRIKKRATGEQTKRLAIIAKDELHREDILAKTKAQHTRVGTFLPRLRTLRR